MGVAVRGNFVKLHSFLVLLLVTLLIDTTETGSYFVPTVRTQNLVRHLVICSNDNDYHGPCSRDLYV